MKISAEQGLSVACSQMHRGEGSWHWGHFSALRGRVDTSEVYRAKRFSVCYGRSQRHG